MNNTHYVVEVKSDYGMLGVHEIGYVFDTLKEVEEKIKIVQEQKSTSSIKVIEYQLVYDHKNYLPKPDGFNQFFKENIYNEKHVNENPKIAKVKDYKDNIQDYSEIFKIKYVALDERSELEGTDYALKYFKEVNCVYNAESLKEAKEMLRSHTKSNKFFDIKMYQCREIEQI